ncbi:MAG: cellulase [Fibrobacter sp.]|jgi:endoglucanase|nr:cellulase [Fibrobacter sp.]
MVVRFKVSVIILCACIVSSFGAAIHLNQTGFYPEGIKKAVAIGATSDSFFVYNSQDQKVYAGALSGGKFWDASGENARIADFSAFKETGNFKIRIQGCPDSYEFTIANDVHLQVAKASIKAFYFNRASMALDAQYAGKWARSAGHPDNAVQIHQSAAFGQRTAGSTISSPGGWYDAGDYGKYIVNSGITTYTMFAAYEAFPSFYDTLNLNIPESNNDLPDLIDEVLWNLRWMLTMQDSQDGGVYHKLTSRNFCGMIMPEEDDAPRYVIMKSTAATLDFAAVTAQAYRILKKFESQLPGFADQCLTASLNAWKWARSNPAVRYNQTNHNRDYDPDITTGEYGDNNVSDEFKWAATELYIATKQDSFFTIAYPSGMLDDFYTIPAWPGVATLSLYSLFLNKKDLTSAVDEGSIVAKILDLAGDYVARCDTNPYGIGMTASDFYWGSSAVAANQGMAAVFAYLAGGDAKYKNTAINQFDYLLGRNPTGYSFVTGYGDKTPMFIHHRPSEADGIDEPIPGFVVGGPNKNREDAKDCKNAYTSELPALSYIDLMCSYASNEIAINWNAPLVFLSGAIEALQGPSVNTRNPVTVNKKSKFSVIKKKGQLRIDFPNVVSGNLKVFGIDGKVLKTKVVNNLNRVEIKTDWPGQMVLIRFTEEGTGTLLFVEKIFTGMVR